MWEDICQLTRREHILVQCFKEKLSNLWNSLQIFVCYDFEVYCYVQLWGLLTWRSPQRWWRVFLHCSSSLGLLIHASPSATGPGPQALCLPQRWSLSSSPSSSHSSTPWGEKSGKVAAEIHTLIQLSNQIPVPDLSGQIHFFVGFKCLDNVWVNKIVQDKEKKSSCYVPNFLTFIGCTLQKGSFTLYYFLFSSINIGHTLF